jgi:hypothetical protein
MRGRGWFLAELWRHLDPPRKTDRRIVGEGGCSERAVGVKARGYLDARHKHHAASHPVERDLMERIQAYWECRQQW